MGKNDEHEKPKKALAAARALRSNIFNDRQLDAIIETLVSTAQKHASSKKTTEGEKDVLSAGIERFALARGGFVQGLENMEPSARSGMIDSVAAMLFGAMAFALNRPLTEGARRKFNEELGHAIREARAINDQEKHDRLRNYLLEKELKMPLQDTDKFAESIMMEKDFEPTFRDLHRDGKKWPSKRTIRRHIQAILAERRRS